MEVEQAPSVPYARWLAEVHVLVEEVDWEEAAGLLRNTKFVSCIGTGVLHGLVLLESRLVPDIRFR